MQSEELKELLTEMKIMRAELQQLKSAKRRVEMNEGVEMSKDADDQNDEAVEEPTWLCCGKIRTCSSRRRNTAKLFLFMQANQMP